MGKREQRLKQFFNQTKMKGNTNIRYIKQNDIDSGKWNHCIENAINSRIYANDWHLDRTTETWDALVWGNYEYIMPLPFRKKIGIKYLYQPLYSQQLGIFPSPPEKVATTFVRFIHARFYYCQVNMNAENLPVKLQKVEFLPRKNYLLPLNDSYTSLSASFSKNTKRNITKALKHSLALVEGIRLEEYLEFKSHNLRSKVSHKEFTGLKSLISLGQYKGFGQIYGVYSNHNQLCAAVYFCRWKNRIIYFNAASDETGRKLGAMYFLLNKFIEDNAGKNLLLDFEGSMIPGVARFYEGFGATSETYFQLKFNRLPLPLRWLKR